MCKHSIGQLLLGVVLTAGNARTAEGPAAAPLPDSSSAKRRELTLREAQETAVQNNPDFRNIKEQIYQAEVSIQRAWSMLVPKLTAEGSITRNRDDAVISIPTGGAQSLEVTIQDLWEESAGFNINLTLFDPESIPTIKLAYDEAERRRIQARINRNELLFTVTSMFYQAHAMKKLTNAARENLETARAFLNQAKTRELAGEGTMVDLNRSELQVLTAEEDLADAQDAEERALIALKHLIQWDGDFDVAAPEAAVPVSQTLDGLTERALEKRLELKEVAVKKRMADRSRSQTLAKFLPKLDLTYIWDWSSTKGFTDENVNWRLIFGAKWYLFQGGDRIGEYKTRQSETRVVNNQRDKLISDLKEEIETRYLNVQQQKRKLEVAIKKIQLADDNHRLITARFQAGVVSSLEVITTAKTLSNQRLLSVYQRLLLDLAVLELRKAAGEYNESAAGDPVSPEK